MVDVNKMLMKMKTPVQKQILKEIGTGDPKILYTMMRDYPQRGGKFIRPTLIQLSCEALGGKINQAMNTAVAYETFENWILIHDDVEDQSDERRGKPCLHHLHGEAMAINAGDALHAQMWRVLMKNFKLLGEKKATKVMDEMINVIETTTKGQTMELYWVENKIWDVKEKDYYKMIGWKTAPYTITSPCKLGAIVAGAHNSIIEQFEAFGDALGKAFQLQDDILNLVADKGKYGKEIAGDLYEGKRTLILIHLLKHCTKAEKKKIVKIVNKPRDKIRKTEVKWILGLMKKYGSIEYAKKDAHKYAVKSRKLFKKMKFKNKKAAAKIESIIDFVVNREL